MRTRNNLTVTILGEEYISCCQDYLLGSYL
jgi:hypothetical protein